MITNKSYITFQLEGETMLQTTDKKKSMKMLISLSFIAENEKISKEVKEA